MFIMTAKLTKGKAIAGTVLGGIIFCALIFAAGSLLHKNAFDVPPVQDVTDNAKRVAYLTAWGWQVDPSAVETLDLVLPQTLDESYAEYNTLQAENGMDLSPYCGKRVKRYTYTVLNYPESDKAVQANLYLCGNTVIAGDIMSSGADGFIAALHYPK